MDANQDAVVSALEAAGAKVEVISKPLDLQVGGINKRGEKVFLIMEIKVPGGKRTPFQKGYFERWDGYPIALVDGPDAAVRAYRVLIA